MLVSSMDGFTGSNKLRGLKVAEVKNKWKWKTGESHLAINYLQLVCIKISEFQSGLWSRNMKSDLNARNIFSSLQYCVMNERKNERVDY